MTGTKMYDASIIQDDMVVASVSAPSREVAEREIRHYAMLYSQDGDVRIVRDYDA